MDENLPPKLSRLKMNIVSPGTVHKHYHHRESQDCGSSCSSSETSDDNSENHERLDKDRGLAYSWHRRDSSEGPPGREGDGDCQSKPSSGGSVDKSSPCEQGTGGGQGGSGGTSSVRQVPQGAVQALTPPHPPPPLPPHMVQSLCRASNS